MKDSVNVLEKAKGEYELAVADISDINSQLQKFNLRLTQMTDKDSEKYADWTSALRSGGKIAPADINELHRHSSLHTHFSAKFGHENEGLGTQKSLLAGGNGLTFDARYLLDF